MANYLADVIIWGISKTDHDVALRAVLQRLNEHRLLLNTSKCHFNRSCLHFLGHTVTAKEFSLMRITIRLFFMLQNLQMRVSCDHSWDCTPCITSLHPALLQLWNHYVPAYDRMLCLTGLKKHSVVLKK